MNISVIGAGSWGTALALLLNDNGHNVTIWSLIKDEVKMLNEHREHQTKLPGIAISEDIVITSDVEMAVKDKSLIVLAVPSKFVRTTTELLKPYLSINQILVNVAKGLEDETLYTPDQVIKSIVENPVVVLSGPSHAEEVARKIPTSIVVASNDEEIVEVIKQEAKKIKDAIEGFEKGGRLEQAEEERKQLSFIEKYLPEQMSEEEVRKIVTEVIEENKIEDMKGIGVVMKEVMAKTKGEADGKLINQIAREILQ